MATEVIPTGLEDLRYWKKKLWGRPADFAFVYVIQGAPGTPIKVGLAKDPVKRMATLQTGYPWDLRLLYVFPADRGLEQRLHVDLAEGRLRGEWFDGPVVDDLFPFFAELRASFRRAGALEGSTTPWNLHYWQLRKRMAMAAEEVPSPRGQPAPVTVRHVAPSPLAGDELEERRKQQAYEAEVRRQRNEARLAREPNLA